MDVEKLIVLVQERPAIWDQKLPQYHMRNVQQQLWEEIGKEMNETVVEIKKKWKGLRDTFRKELRKCLQEKSGSEAGSSKQWPFFSQLEFLSDTMMPKDTQTSIPDEEQYSGEISQSSSVNSQTSQREGESTDAAQEENTDSEPPPTPPQKLFKSPPKRHQNIKRQKKDEFDENFLEIEQKKLEMFRENSKKNNDDDYHFLMSLHPYLHQVPAERKLQARMDLMDVVMRHQMGGDTFGSRPNYCTNYSSVGSSFDSQQTESFNIQQYYNNFNA